MNWDSIITSEIVEQLRKRKTIKFILTAINA